MSERVTADRADEEDVSVIATMTTGIVQRTRAKAYRSIGSRERVEGIEPS